MLHRLFVVLGLNHVGNERNTIWRIVRAYNELITAWHAIEAASHDADHVNVQGSFDV